MASFGNHGNKTWLYDGPGLTFSDRHEVENPRTKKPRPTQKKGQLTPKQLTFTRVKGCEFGIHWLGPTSSVLACRSAATVAHLLNFAPAVFWSKV
jgi:hypothetical protein